MLLLTFRAAGNAYAIEARRIVEIVPRIELRSLPHAPAYLAGLFDYRGTVVPVVDMGLLLGASACRASLHTRIIVAGYAAPGRRRGLLGLQAEHVNDLKQVAPQDRGSPAMPIPEATYLGPIYRLDDILVQMLEIDRLLPESLRDSLFGESAEGL